MSLFRGPAVQNCQNKKDPRSRSDVRNNARRIWRESGNVTLSGESVVVKRALQLRHK